MYILVKNTNANKKKGRIFMSISKEEYGRMAKRAAPRSPVLADCIWAFCIGGFICALAEGIYLWMDFYGLDEKQGRSVAMISIIVLTAILTAVGVFDNIAKHAGAGTLVPITGFANAVASPAIEFKTEGFITGLGAKMFVIAGPVIVYGIAASIVYGIIYWIVSLF